MFATVLVRTKTNTIEFISAVLDSCCAHVYMNGAFIETSTGHALHDSQMDHAEVLAIIEKCDRSEASVCCISLNEAAVRILHPKCDSAFRPIHKQLDLGNWPTPFN